jgi:hypothetical protein
MRRLGAILCLVLGAVLIGTGLNSTSAGTVGGTVPDCGTLVGVTVACPTATITFTETTTGAGAPAPVSWTVHVTSTCHDPATGLPVNQTVTVPNDGHASTTDLYLYVNSTHTTACVYNYVESPIPAHFTATFAPLPPQGLVASEGLDVTLTNAYTAPHTTSAAPSTTTVTVAPSSSAAVQPTSTDALANTGPRSQVRASVWIGAGLCALGLVLLVAGRRRRPASHHD